MERALHVPRQAFHRPGRAHDPARLEPHVNQREELRIHLESQFAHLSAQLTACRAELAATQAILKATQIQAGTCNPDCTTLIH